MAYDPNSSPYGGSMFAGYQVPESVRAQILASQLLGQSAAASNQPFTSRGILFAKAAAGLLSGLSEGSAIRNEEAAQRQSAATLAAALQAKYGTPAPYTPSPGAAAPSPPASPPSPIPQQTSSAAPVPTGSASDRDLAIRTIYGEAGGEGPQGQAAVASVIRNRMMSGDYGGNTLSGVVTAPKQFSLWNPGDPAGDSARRLDPSSPAYQQIGQIYDGVMSGQIPDPTNGADHYYNPKVADPAWGDALGQRNSVTIGNHRFVGGNGPVASAADMPAPNASPTGSTALPPGITPDMVSAPQAGDATSTGSGTMGAAQAQAMAAALRASPDASAPPLSAPATAPGAPGYPNAIDYALKNTGTRDQFAPGPVVGGMGAVPTTVEPSMFAPPDPNAVGLPSVGQTTQSAGSSAISDALSDPSSRAALAGLLAAPSDDDTSAASAPPVANNPSPPLPAIAPPVDNSAGNSAPPPAASALASPPPQAPAQQAINAAVPPSPQPMTAPSVPPQALAAALAGNAPVTRGAFDPSSPQAFNAQQASSSPLPALLAQLLGGGSPAAGNAGALPNALGSSAPAPQLAQQNGTLGVGIPSGVGNALGMGSGGSPPGASLASPGVFGGLGSMLGLGGQAPAGPTPTGQAALQAAMLDPRIPQSVKLQLFQPAPLDKIDAGQTLYDPRTRQPVFTAQPKADWHYDPQSGLSSNAATGEVRQAGQPLGDYGVTRDGVVYDKRSGQTVAPQAGGATGYRMMTPEEKQAAGIPLDQPTQIGPNGKISSGTGQTINVGGEQNVYDTTMAKTMAENHVALMQGVEANRTKLRDLNAMSGALQRLQQNGGTTGLGSEEIKDLQSAVNTGANALGLGQQYDISDKEVLSKLATQLSGAQAKDIGGARTTNFDMQQMLKANPGLELSPTGNQRMLGIGQQVTQRNIDIGTQMQAAAAQAVQQGRRINPQQMEQIRADYDASHHIVDPITGQDLSASPSLPEFSGASSGQQGAPTQQPQALLPAQSAAPVQVQPSAQAGALAQAQAAIARGAPRAAVIQRLQQMGISPVGL